MDHGKIESDDECGETMIERRFNVEVSRHIKAVTTYFFVIAMSVFCSLFLTKIDFKSVFSASHPATKILPCTNAFYKDQYSEVLFTSPWKDPVR